MSEITELPDEITYDDKYGPAMTLTTPRQADRYFDVLVAHCLKGAAARGIELTREQAEVIERSYLGFWAGKYDRETRERVERLFRCEHPFLGPVSRNLTPEEVLQIGIAAGQRSREEHLLAPMDVQERFRAYLVAAIHQADAEGAFIKIDGVVPTSGKYILDEAGNPAPEYDLLKWCAWFESADNERHIANTHLPSDEDAQVRVSTIFLGMDFVWHDELPLLWETHVFGGEFDGYQERYYTRQEALAGHERAVLLHAMAAMDQGETL